MDDIKKQKKISVGFWVFLLAVCGFVLAAWRCGDTEPDFNEEKVYELDTVWHGEEQPQEVDSLPAFFSCDENGTASISTTISEEWLERGNTICFRASQEAVRIWMDDTLLLEQGNRTPSLFGKAPGSSWVMLRLPADSAGKELKIELSSPYEEYQGLLNKVYIGTKAALLFWMLYTYGPGLAVAVLFLIMSVVLFLFYLLFLVRKISGTQFLLLAGFGMLAAVWMLGESYMLQFFTGRLQAWYVITLLALHLLPQPLLKILENLPNYSYWHICRSSRYFLMLYLILLILLQIMGFCDFMQMLNVSLVILLVICVVNLFFIYWEFFHNKNKEILAMIVAISVFSVFACLELTRGLIDIRKPLGTFLQIGVLAFYVILCIFSVRNTLNLYAEGLKSEYYKKLSFFDQMTGCMNRRAYMEREKNWMSGGNDVMLMMDLNNLKQVNDVLGHDVGDIYIKRCADILRDIFGSMGNCYRMGGDEFLFWGEDISEETMERLEEQLRLRVQVTCEEISSLCGAATGYAVARPEDKSVQAIWKRADEKMYENKRLIKK